MQKTNDIVTCVATLTAKENQAAKLCAALEILLEPTRSEHGCLSYELYQNLGNAQMFTMIEKFRNKEAFDYHNQQPYLVAFKQIVGDLVESVSITSYKEVGEVNL